MIGPEPRIPTSISHDLRLSFSCFPAEIPACLQCRCPSARSKPINASIAPGNNPKRSSSRVCREKKLAALAPLPSRCGMSVDNTKYPTPRCSKATARNTRCHDDRFWAFTGVNTFGRTISALSDSFLTQLPRIVIDNKPTALQARSLVNR